MTRSRAIVLSSVVMFLARTPVAMAKPPSLTGIFPAGAARGQNVTVTMSGSLDHWPVKCWVDGKGVSIEASTDKRKLAVRVAGDAEPGVRWVRVYDEEGATSPRPFIVGTLPEVAEVEPNDDPRHSQSVGPKAATVNGRLSRPGDVDGFAVKLNRGQTIVADLEANRHLGSPMDAVLQVVSAEGFVLAQNDDFVGRDPRIIFDAPASAVYTIRVFAFPVPPGTRIKFAGGDAFIYRLTLTTRGFLDHAFPLAVSQDIATPIIAIGPNIPPCARALRFPPNETHDVFSFFHPTLPGIAKFRRVTGRSVVEVEPNDLAHPQDLADRDAISGGIDPPGDRDVYRLDLRKGEPHIISVESRALGLPLDPLVQVLDAKGKVLVETDDVGESRDPELTFTPPAHGPYCVVVRDLNGRGGPRYSYLLRVFAPEPDFTLSLATDTFTVISGNKTKILVNIDRKNGFNDMLDVTAVELPKGVVATTARSRQSDSSARSVTLEIQADKSAHSGPIRIAGRSADGKQRPRFAFAPIPGFEAKTDHPWLKSRPAAKQKKP